MNFFTTIFHYLPVFFVIFVIIPGKSQSGFNVQLEIENNRNYPIEINLNKGDIYETINPDNNRQNLVLARDTTIQLGPREKKEVILEAYCTTEHRDAPEPGEPLRITPLNSEVPFETQEDIWNFYRNYRNR